MNQQSRRNCEDGQISAETRQPKRFFESRLHVDKQDEPVGFPNVLSNFRYGFGLNDLTNRTGSALANKQFVCSL